jgi:hypothetical protein
LFSLHVGSPVVSNTHFSFAFIISAQVTSRCL